MKSVFVFLLTIWGVSVTGHEGWQGAWPRDGEVFNGVYFRLLAFDRLPSSDDRRRWAQMGLRLVDYRHPNQYYAVISVKFTAWEAVKGLRAVRRVPEAIKMHPDLRRGRVPEWARTSRGVRVVVAYYKGLEEVEVVAALRRRGMTIGRRKPWAYQVEGVVPIRRVDAVARLPFVQYVDLTAPPPVPEENRHYLSAVNRSNAVHHLPGKTYNGEGVRIMFSEGQRIRPLLEFSGRLWVWNEDDIEGAHITGVAYHGASAAVPNASLDLNAWGATIVSAPYPVSYDSAFTHAQVLYTNHSLGFGIQGGYDATSRALDLLTEAHPEIAVFFSAGNSGTSTGFAPYSFAGWANITGTLKQNKNHFATGAVSWLGELFAFSSRGPMYDGRLYPLVVNEGEDGTSYASPKTMGNVAILQQVWKDLHNDSLAPAYVLRAVLALTADDIENPGPDYKSGFGMVNLRRAYRVLEEGRLRSDTVDHSEVDSFFLSVPAGAAELRVLVMWPDPAAPIGAAKALINDLDLELVDGSGTTYRPWVLNPYPHPDSLDLPARRGIDTLNNVELVTVPWPDSGQWMVRVRGRHVPMGPQAYVVAYEWVMPELVITFPHEGAQLDAADDVVIYWDDYTGGGGTYTVKYQVDGGPWQVAGTGLSNAVRAYLWTPPGLPPGVHTVRFVVERGGWSDTSAVATIAVDPPGGIRSECTPGRIVWDSVAGVAGYAVFYLDSTRMRRLTHGVSISGSSALITGLDISRPQLMAVAGIDSQGNVGYWHSPVWVDLSGRRYSLPSDKGFESDPLGSAPLLDGGWWITSSPERFTWTVHEGPTPSLNTGPTQAAVGRKYLYTEASLFNVPPEPPSTLLTSPCLAGNGGFLSFFYHMYGATMGTLYVEGWDSASAAWTVLDSIAGPQQQASNDAWRNRHVSLQGLAEPFRVRFRAVRGSDYQSDIALDEISVVGPVKLVMPTRGDRPHSGCGLTAQEPIRWVMQNVGLPLSADDTLNYRVVVDGIPACAGRHPIGISLSTGDSLQIEPSGCTLDVSAAGEHTVSVVLWFDGSDTTTHQWTFRNYPVIDRFPYREGFESDDGGWVPGGYPVSWEWGVPAGTHINTAAEGSKVWMTRLDGPPHDDERGWLVSPCFTAFPHDSMELALSIWWEAYDRIDGAAVDIWRDGAWHHLETDDTSGWYVGNVTALRLWQGVTHQRGWTGRSVGWRRPRVRFDVDPTDTIQFRVMFAIDGVSLDDYDGVAIDDVALHAPDRASGVGAGAVVEGGIYPNPADRAVWWTPSFSAGGGRLRIIAADGRVVWQARRSWNEGRPLRIELPADWPAGVYLLEVRSKVAVRRFVFTKQ